MLSIIGTDTEIGKTVVAAALVRAFRRLGIDAAGFKPFACDPALDALGGNYSTDAALLARVSKGLSPGEVCGELFRAPLSPLAASRLEDRKVDIDSARKRTHACARRHELLIVEGCGGWEVPLTSRRTTADFFASLGAPVLIVGRAGLGTLNHCLLTHKAVLARGLHVLGFVLNRNRPGAVSQAERGNPGLLHEMTQRPVWGPLPYRTALDRPQADLIEPRRLPDLRDIAQALRLKR
jgi:dethiobiotin synthetase